MTLALALLAVLGRASRAEDPDLPDPPPSEQQEGVDYGPEHQQMMLEGAPEELDRFLRMHRSDKGTLGAVGSLVKRLGDKYGIDLRQAKPNDLQRLSPQDLVRLNVLMKLQSELSPDDAGAAKPQPPTAAEKKSSPGGSPVSGAPSGTQAGAAGLGLGNPAAGPGSSGQANPLEGQRHKSPDEAARRLGKKQVGGIKSKAKEEAEGWFEGAKQRLGEFEKDGKSRGAGPGKPAHPGNPVKDDLWSGKSDIQLPGPPQPAPEAEKDLKPAPLAFPLGTTLAAVGASLRALAPALPWPAPRSPLGLDLNEFFREREASRDGSKDPPAPPAELARRLKGLGPKDAAAAPELLTLLFHVSYKVHPQDAEIRGLVEQALRAMGGGALPAIRDAALGEDTRVGVIALRLLSSFDLDLKDVGPLLGDVLVDGYLDSRLEAVRQLTAKGPAALPYLEPALALYSMNRWESNPVYETARDAIRGMGPDAIPALLALQKAKPRLFFAIGDVLSRFSFMKSDDPTLLAQVLSAGVSSESSAKIMERLAQLPAAQLRAAAPELAPALWSKIGAWKNIPTQDYYGKEIYLHNSALAKPAMALLEILGVELLSAVNHDAALYALLKSWQGHYFHSHGSDVGAQAFGKRVGELALALNARRPHPVATKLLDHLGGDAGVRAVLYPVLWAAEFKLNSEGRLEITYAKALPELRKELANDGLALGLRLTAAGLLALAGGEDRVSAALSLLEVLPRASGADAAWVRSVLFSMGALPADRAVLDRLQQELKRLPPKRGESRPAEELRSEAQALAAVRRTAARLLDRMGPAAKEALPALLDALKDPDAEVRQAAAWALAAVVAQDPAPVMLRLGDPDPAVRSGASVALSLLMDQAQKEGKPVPELVPTLAAALRSADPKDRELALAALAGLGPAGAAALPEVLALLEGLDRARVAASPELDALVLLVAALAEGDAPELPDSALAPLEDALKGKYPFYQSAVRVAAAKALLLLRPARKKAVIEALLDVAKSAHDFGKRRTRADMEVAMGAGMEAGREAISILGSIATPEDAAVEPALAAFLESPVRKTRVAAAIALGRIFPGDERAVKELREVVENRGLPEVRAAALRGLLRVGADPATLAEAIKFGLKDDKNADVQQLQLAALQTAAQAAAPGGPLQTLAPEARSALVRALLPGLLDKDAAVADASLRALAGLDPAALAAWAQGQGFLAGPGAPAPHPVVAAAATVLSLLGSPGGPLSLRQALLEAGASWVAPAEMRDALGKVVRGVQYVLDGPEGPEWGFLGEDGSYARLSGGVYVAGEPSGAFLTKGGAGEASMAAQGKGVTRKGPDGKIILEWARGQDGGIEGSFHGHRFKRPAGQQVAESPDGEQLHFLDEKGTLLGILAKNGVEAKPLEGGIGFVVETGGRKTVLLDPESLREEAGRAKKLEALRAVLKNHGDAALLGRYFRYLDETFDLKSAARGGVVSRGFSNAVRRDERGREMRIWLEDLTLDAETGELRFTVQQGVVGADGRITEKRQQLEAIVQIQTGPSGRTELKAYYFYGSGDGGEQIERHEFFSRGGAFDVVLADYTIIGGKNPGPYQENGRLRWHPIETQGIDPKSKWAAHAPRLPQRDPLSWADQMWVDGAQWTVGAVGTGAEFVFSPVQSVIALGTGYGSKVMASPFETDTAELNNMHGDYSLAQTKIGAYLGGDLNHSDDPVTNARNAKNRLDLYKKSTKKLSWETFKYLEGEFIKDITEANRRFYGELWFRYENLPITEQMKADLAANFFGVANLPANYFKLGRHHWDSGNKVMGALHYVVGGGIIAQQAQVEMVGMGPVLSAAKLTGVGARFGMTGFQVAGAVRKAELIARGAKGIKLTRQEAQAVKWLKGVNLAEDVFMDIPSVHGAVESSLNLLYSPNPEVRRNAVDQLLNNLANFAGGKLKGGSKGSKKAPKGLHLPEKAKPAELKAAFRAYGNRLAVELAGAKPGSAEHRALLNRYREFLDYRDHVNKHGLGPALEAQPGWIAKAVAHVVTRIREEVNSPRWSPVRSTRPRPPSQPQKSAKPPEPAGPK